MNLKTYQKLNLLITRFPLMLLLVLLFNTAIAQETAVTGTVKAGNTGEVLPGVSVLIKGTSTGTITDLDGKFSITVPNADAILVFSFIGYKKTEVPVKGQKVLDVNLEVETSALDEVVVIGYGVQKKSDLTGAIATIKTDQLTQLSTINVQEAIEGRVAGVMVTSNTGEPGSGVRVRIRGISTINNSDPLYIVDGFPVGDISYLNPNDIETMSVLKDASATAIYGNRGATGVVLITTKKGNAKKSMVTFNAFYGTSEANKTIPVLNAEEYATVKRAAFKNYSQITGKIDEARPGTYYDSLFSAIENSHFKGTDWQNEVLRKGKIQNYSLGVSGGNEKFSYNLSGTYNREDGIITNSWMEKYLLRYGSQFEISKYVKGMFDISYMNRDKTNYDQSLYGQGILPPALYADPVSPVYRPDTAFSGGTDYYHLLIANKLDKYVPDKKNYQGVDVSETTNPVAAADRMRFNRTAFDELVFNLGAEVKIIEGLVFNSKFGTDLQYNRPKRYNPAYAIGSKDLSPQSSLDETHQRVISWNNSNYLTYSKTFMNKLNTTFMVGQEWAYYGNFRTRLIVFDVPEDENLQYATMLQYGTSPVVNPTPGADNWYERENTLTSLYGRVNLSYDEKYMLTANFRQDQSSMMSKNFRKGNFPAFSLAWNIKNENFLKDVAVISALKLRGGWGKTGNVNSVTNPYSVFASVTSGLDMVGPGGTVISGSLQTSNPPTSLQWEVVKMSNIGLDFSLLNNKIIGSVDGFNKITSGMIINADPPYFAGMLSSAGNLGSMENKGLEIALSYKNYDGEFKYEIGGNITFLEHPQVTSLASEGQEILSGTVAKTRNVIRTTAGDEVAYFYGYKTDGLLTQDDINNTYVVTESGDTNYTYRKAAFWPGQIKLVDLNGDGKITNQDKTNIGSANPDFYYGFNVSLSYKWFDLILFFQGVHGNEMINTLNAWLKVPDEGTQNLSKDLLNAWTPENPDTKVMRTVQGNMIFQSFFNDNLVEDASYLRLKNIQLGVTLPNNISKLAGIDHFRFYVSLENYLTFTKYSGLDPEVGNYQYNNNTQRNDPLTQGLDDASYPIAKRILVGVNVNF